MVVTFSNYVMNNVIKYQANLFSSGLTSLIMFSRPRRCMLVLNVLAFVLSFSCFGLALNIWSSLYPSGKGPAYSGPIR